MSQDHAWLLNQLSAKAGFSISEPKLSPQTRQRIGHLSSRRYELSRLTLRASSKETQIAESIKYVVISAAMGIILVALLSITVGSTAYFGTLVWVVSGLVYQFRYRPVQKELHILRDQIAEATAELDTAINEMARDISAELSEVHEQEVRPKVTKVESRFG